MSGVTDSVFIGGYEDSCHAGLVGQVSTHAFP